MNKTLEIPKNTKVFIVEDDAFISSLLIKKFESIGATVSICAAGDVAAASIKRDLPDIIVLDIMLPKADGFQVLQELKADPETKNIPVVMLSNFGEKAQIEKAKQYGAAIFLIKATLSIDEIAEEIIKQIKTEKMARG